MSYRLLSDSATGGTLPGGVADVRGWPVRDDAGALLGAVTDVVFDEFAQTRYLVVELSTSGTDDTRDTFSRTARSRGGALRILLPVAMARVGAPAGEVTVPGASANALARLPEYRDDPAATIAELERRGGNLLTGLTDPNALGATRSADPDVHGQHLSGNEVTGLGDR